MTTTGDATLTTLDIDGEGEAAGAAYGEACRALIADHRELVVERLVGGHDLALDDLRTTALRYREATVAAHPDLAAEVDGVARGAGLPVAESWMLQLRAELTPGEGELTPECTSLALTGSASGSAGTLAAQNLDLPPAYQPLLVLLRRWLPGDRIVLTLTPAGQIGQHGINDAGVAVLANFLRCAGWQVGVPRYLLSRIALAQRTREAALRAVERTRRASPRNLLIADRDGATSLETVPSATARVEPDATGRLLHTNHFLSELRGAETASPTWLRNSRRRLWRLGVLLGGERPVSVGDLRRILADRDGAPDAICHQPGDADEDYATVASTIADTAARRLWIAIGPPDVSEHRPYDVFA